MIDFAELSQFWSVAVAHGEAKAALAPLATTMTSDGLLSESVPGPRGKGHVYIGI